MTLKQQARNVLLALVLIVNGCANDNLVTIADRSYFPLSVGNYQIYQVIETDIDRLSCSVTSPVRNYQLKVSIFDSAKNSEGGYTYDIHRFTRPDSTQAWMILDTWTARANANQVVQNEGNVPYVKLIFPMISGEQWNGNTYNNNPEEGYTMNNVGKSYSLDNGKKFASTVTVVQSDNQDFIVYQDKRLEVYAAFVGLIYKETIQLTYFQNDCGSANTCCLGTQDAKNGIMYTQELKSYGRE